MTFARNHQEWRERRASEKERNLALLCRPLEGDGAEVMGRVRALHTGVYGAATLTAVPKTEPKRNRALLDMAQGRECLLRIPGVCSHDRETTVAAHSNESKHGKAGARKADDCYSAWGCFACHSWLDQGSAPQERKALFFGIAHAQQQEAWARIAEDPTEPERFRKAAQWALDQLKEAA